MTLTREHGLWAIAAAVLLAAGIWFARHTEWVDEEVDDPPSAELRRDPDLRLKQVIAKLGATVATPTDLDALPPPGATLLLSSLNWNLFAGREAALRQWVEAGGQLVVPSFGRAHGGLDWVPIVEKRQAKAPASATSAASAASPPALIRTDDDDDSDDVADTKPPARPQFGAPPPLPRCPGINEPAGVAPAFGVARGYATCMFTGNPLQANVAPSWALDGPRGPVIVRMPLGRGSVTVIGANPPFENAELPEHDNALIAVATLQLRPGHTVWIVRDEARPPLLAFLWQRGAPAVLLGAAALAFALWRGARRFGPRAATVPLARRSMREQIRGTAGFIAHRGSPALHAAQMRALTDAATPRIHGFALMTTGQRAQAIAALTGMDLHTLSHAMNPSLNATRTRHPAAALALLEAARRRLRDAARRPATASTTASATAPESR